MLGAWLGSLVGVFGNRSSTKEEPSVTSKRSGVEASSRSATGVWRIGINEKGADGNSEQFVLGSCWGEDMIEERI